MTPIRNRIKELRSVPARELRANPHNWRVHPQRQRRAMSSLLKDVGYAGALLARECDDGTLELIDGHLRAETTPDDDVPVLVLDVNEAEAMLLLASFDPLSSMARPDEVAVEKLLADLRRDSPSAADLLNELGLPGDGLDELDTEDELDLSPTESYQVVIHCDDENEQRAVYDRLTNEGLRCRLLIM